MRSVSSSRPTNDDGDEGRVEPAWRGGRVPRSTAGVWRWSGAISDATRSASRRSAVGSQTDFGQHTGCPAKGAQRFGGALGRGEGLDQHHPAAFAQRLHGDKRLRRSYRLVDPSGVSSAAASTSPRWAGASKRRAWAGSARHRSESPECRPFPKVKGGGE